MLPVDIYLENHVYAWGGILNQPSGTLAERIAKLQANGKLAIAPNVFRAFSAAHEAEFEGKLSTLKDPGAAAKERAADEVRMAARPSGVASARRQ